MELLLCLTQCFLENEQLNDVCDLSCLLQLYHSNSEPSERQLPHSSSFAFQHVHVTLCEIAHIILKLSFCVIGFGTFLIPPCFSPLFLFKTKMWLPLVFLFHRLSFHELIAASVILKTLLWYLNQACLNCEKNTSVSLARALHFTPIPCSNVIISSSLSLLHCLLSFVWSQPVSS